MRWNQFWLSSSRSLSWLSWSLLEVELFSVFLLAKVSRAVFDTLAVCYTILWLLIILIFWLWLWWWWRLPQWWWLWLWDKLWWSKPGSRQPPDSDEDSGRRGLVVGIPQQPEVIFIFRTNLKWAFVSIRLSVSPTNHPPMHPFLHPSIHPCLSTCPVDKLTSKNGCVHPSTWPSAKEVPGMLMTNQWRNRESTSTKSTVYNLALSVSSLWYG